MSSLINNLTRDTAIPDYAFTQRSSRNLNAVVRSDDFSTKSAEAIYTYLVGQMSCVKFCDYLKRYLYEHHDFGMPYAEVPLSAYSDLLLSSFRENNMPVVAESSSRRPAAAVKKWLTQASVRRPIVFQLGFGLKMKPEEVDLFLKKALNEPSFNMTDPTEAVFQYCYYNQLGYDKACSLLEYYQSIDKNAAASPAETGRFHIGKMTGDAEIRAYLEFLKKRGSFDNKKNAAYDLFDLLIGRVRSIIAADKRLSHLAHDSAGMATGHTIGLETSQVSNQIIEETIYSGISFTGEGNLQSMADSTLKELFQRYRLTRARINNIQRRKAPVERFDLITLLFFIYAQTYAIDSDLTPKELCLRFIDEINKLLVQCGMIRLYPVNPYESFILLCLLSEDPWDSFCEVWYQSYHEDRQE